MQDKIADPTNIGNYVGLPHVFKSRYAQGDGYQSSLAPNMMGNGIGK